MSFVRGAKKQSVADVAIAVLVFCVLMPSLLDFPESGCEYSSFPAPASRGQSRRRLPLSSSSVCLSAPASLPAIRLRCPAARSPASREKIMSSKCTTVGCNAWAVVGTRPLSCKAHLANAAVSGANAHGAASPAEAQAIAEAARLTRQGMRSD